MPKRQKPKVKSNAGDKQYDGQATSRARLAAQDAREKVNRWAFPELTPWEKAKAVRHQKRKLAGKTYENWRKLNSARVSEPNVSNTSFTRHPEKVGRNERGGRYSSKVRVD